MDWLARFVRWLQGIFDRHPKLVVSRSEETPEAPRRNVLYLIGNPNQPWAASFLCPCGCGETVSLSLIATDRPSWRVHVSSEGKVTLAPSIWRTRGCRSHFFVEESRIVWVRAVARPLYDRA